MAILTVSHYIFLNKDDRYRLHAGEAVEVVGVSIPVWFKKGTTSEPAQEVFCKYKLTNEKVNRAIVPTDEGYHINLPQKMDLKLSEGVQEAVGLEMPTSERLLDIKDGGSELIHFRQYNKVHRGKKKFDVVHFVELKPIETLLETLC